MSTSISRLDVETASTAAAFGADPGAFPLPMSEAPLERWRSAVALGGQGRYSSARARLTALTRGAAVEPAVASLAWSTQASLLRQLGWHRTASGLDGRALAVVGLREQELSGGDPTLVHEARCDALTGLAADALGCGRLALGWRLLDRCGAYLDAWDGARVLWRQRIRRYWVSAELAMAGGDFLAARQHAEAAAEISQVCGSVRHQVKSDLLRSASMTADPDRGPATSLAEEVLGRCEEHGLIPLRWAAAMLLEGVGGDRRVGEVRRECEALIRARGGRFRF